MAAQKDFLLKFLEKRLFNIGAADDERLKGLRTSVQTVVDAMHADITLVIPFSLVALDPETPAEDPVFETVANAVQEQWNAYTEQYPDTPRTLFRAILLDAILIVAEKRVEVAGAVDLLCRNLMPSVEAGGEAPLLQEFANKMAALAQDEADAHWDTAFHEPLPKAQAIKLGSIAPRAVKINRDDLRQGFEVPSWNQYNWQNNANALHSHIMTQGVEKVASTIEAAVKAGGISGDDLQKNVVDPIQRALKELMDRVSAVATATQVPAQILKKQLDLLWWKEASFSETLQKSYRLVPRELMALAFAIDFANLVPAWCPRPVERFLAQAFWKESESKVAKADVPKLLISDYLERIQSNKNAPVILSKLPTAVDRSKGRSTLVSFISDLVHGTTVVAHLEERTGLETSEVGDDAAICLRLFREMQALRLIGEEQNGEAE